MSEKREKFEAQVRGIVSWQFSGVTNLTEAAYNAALKMIGEQVFNEVEKAGYHQIPELTVLSPEEVDKYKHFVVDQFRWDIDGLLKAQRYHDASTQRGS